MKSEEKEYLRDANHVRASLLTDEREVTGILWIGPKGLFFQAISNPREHNCLIPWLRIDRIEIDGADALQSRVTVTRLALVGLFAFALKKKTGEVFAYVESGSRQLLFKLRKKTAPEARAIFAPYQGQMTAGKTAREQAAAARSAEATSSPRIRCEACARMIPADSQKCPECGITIRQAASAGSLTPDAKTCPFCAEEIKFQAIKCKHCGELLGGEATG